MDKQDYADEEVISTYDFIYFVDGISPFLKEYLDYLHDENRTKYNKQDYIETTDYNEYNSLIDRCEEIVAEFNKRHIDEDDGTFNTYRAELMPLMEWITQEYRYMKKYYLEDMRKHKKSLSKTKGGKKRTRKGKKSNKNKTKKLM